MKNVQKKIQTKAGRIKRKSTERHRECNEIKHFVLTKNKANNKKHARKKKLINSSYFFFCPHRHLRRQFAESQSRSCMHVVPSDVGKNELPRNQKCSHAPSSNRSQPKRAGDAHADATLSGVSTGVQCSARRSIRRIKATGSVRDAAICEINANKSQNLC